MKFIALLVAVFTGAILMYAELDFPAWGDPQSPASTHLSPHYITQGFEETAAPNLVTSVLADYRSYDTMFETGVVLVAALAIMLILRRPWRNSIPGEGEEDSDDVVANDVVANDGAAPGDTRGGIATKSGAKAVSITTTLVSGASSDDSIIVRTACRLLIPVMQLFALYVLAHGHQSPGGGFQAGVILGASLILLALAYDLKTALRRFSEKRTMMVAVMGVLLYVGIGFLCLPLGGNFLDYSVWSNILPVSPVMARYHGMLWIEVGVTLAVMAVMFSIYVDLSSRGRLDEGL